MQRDQPSAFSSGLNSLRQRMTSRRGASASRISPMSAVRPSPNLSAHGEPGLKSHSTVMLNQYLLTVRGSVSAAHTFSGVVRT